MKHNTPAELALKVLCSLRDASEQLLVRDLSSIIRIDDGYRRGRVLCEDFIHVVGLESVGFGENRVIKDNAVLLKDLNGFEYVAHPDDVVRIEPDIECIFDFCHQRHVSHRIPFGNGLIGQLEGDDLMAVNSESLNKTIEKSVHYLSCDYRPDRQQSLPRFRQIAKLALPGHGPAGIEYFGDPEKQNFQT